MVYYDVEYQDPRWSEFANHVFRALGLTQIER
jgi:hypothetical protein